MADQLRAGEFFGTVRTSSVVNATVLTDLRHAERRKLPRHAHEAASFTLLLDGDYRERWAQSSAEYRPFTASFHPPDFEHDDEVGVRGAHFFLIEPSCTMLEEARQEGFRLSPVADLTGGAMVWDLLKLFQRWRQTGSDALLTESCVAALWSALGHREEKADPGWMKRVEEAIEAGYRSITVGQLARAAGVHSVHLSRVAKAKWGHSVGERVHRMRIREACERIASEDVPLATLAAELGYTDQSHFHRVFRTFTGTTPGSFRAWTHGVKRFRSGRAL